MGVAEMNKRAALSEFFSGFGIPSYVSTSVPENAPFPRLTYDPVFNSFDFTGSNSGEVSVAVNLWYRSESESIPNAKAQEISDDIGIGGKIIPCDEGYIWVKRGSPFCQALSDPDDTTIKRRYLNVTIEYLTAN